MKLQLVASILLLSACVTQADKGAQMSGAPIEYDPSSNSEENQKLAFEAVDDYNKEHPSKIPYRLKKIISFKTHVVAGVIYTLKLELVQTYRCKKDELCPKMKGPTKIVQATKYTRPWDPVDLEFAFLEP